MSLPRNQFGCERLVCAVHMSKLVGDLHDQFAGLGAKMSFFSGS